MAGAGSTAESLTSRGTPSTSTGQMRRNNKPQRLVAERVSTFAPLISHPPNDRNSDATQPGSYFTEEFQFKTLFPQVDTVKPLFQHGETVGKVENGEAEDADESVEIVVEKQKQAFGKAVRLRVRSASVRRLICGAVAGALSRTCVAPLETVRTHLMVGSGGQTVQSVVGHIMTQEGWQGLFRGNGVNVIRVAPSKAIEIVIRMSRFIMSYKIASNKKIVMSMSIGRHCLSGVEQLVARQLFAYDTVKNFLTPKEGEKQRIPFPIAPVAGASAGVCSTVLMYPLELLKTRLTIQRGVYDNLVHALVTICKDEGPKELYRGLTPSLFGVIPYAATNYFTYDTLRKLYKKSTKQDRVGNLATLCIGSASAAVSSACTFPLEVARKQMQLGAVSGRVVYKDIFHALTTILEQQGPAGLYRGLGASCLKLIPAAGISFMCYEAMKQLLIEEEGNAFPK